MFIGSTWSRSQYLALILFICFSYKFALADSGQLSSADFDALRAKIARCWFPPSGVERAAAPIIRVFLRRDGFLASAPIIENDGGNALFQASAESAIKAITNCQPFKLSPEKYDLWKDMEIRFDPHSIPVEHKRAEPRADDARIQLTKLERDGGYRRMSLDDFILDGKQLAATQAKVSIEGFYLTVRDVEYLFSSTYSAAVAQRQFKTDNGVGLLTDGAVRDLRKVFLLCRNHPAFPRIGCHVLLLGHAATCKKLSFGNSSSVPCLVVENGDGVQ